MGISQAQLIYPTPTSLPRGQKSRKISLPPPIGGWNTRDDPAQMGITDATDLVNFFPEITASFAAFNEFIRSCILSQKVRRYCFDHFIPLKKIVIYFGQSEFCSKGVDFLNTLKSIAYDIEWIFLPKKYRYYVYSTRKIGV